jgi:hypothetical protein
MLFDVGLHVTQRLGLGSKLSGSGSILQKKVKLDPTPASPELRTGVTRTTLVLTGTIAAVVNISNPTGTLTLTGLTVGGSLTITSLVTTPLTLVIDGVTCPAGSSFFALYRVWIAASSYVTIQNVNCPNFRIRNARIDAAATLEMANIVTSQAFQLTSNDIANQGTLDVRDSSVGGNMYVYANNFPSNSYLTVRRGLQGRGPSEYPRKLHAPPTD